MAAYTNSDAFFRALNEASREQKSAIFEEIENYKAQQLAEARETAQRKYDEYILEATGGFASEDGAENEKRAAELRKEVMSVRSEITESVFAAVREKLKAFTETDGYEKLLIESARKMAEICGKFPLVIFMREKDLKFSDKIKAVSQSISVKTDESIEIGGIYGVCEEKAVRLNDLLETRLDAQKDWFYENSGLSLR